MTSVAGGRITAGVGANLIGQHAQDRNQEATCYVGNLDDQVTEELLWELFTQAGPVHQVYMPKDRVTTKHKGHAFVEFKGEEDADYAIKVMNMIKVFGKTIRVNKASHDRKATDIGANLFVGNLDPDVDEKLLYDTFSAFGVIASTPKIMRDPDTGVSKGYGFVSFDNFDSSDAAVEAMHGQFLMNRAIAVQYAFKKDSNERHGTPAERLMAQQYRLAAMKSSKPHMLFASEPNQAARMSGPAQAAANGMAAAPAPPAAPAMAAPPPSMPPAPIAAPPWQSAQSQQQQHHTAYPGARPPPMSAATAPPPWATAAAAAAMPPPPWLQQQSGANPARAPPAYPGMARPPPPMAPGVYGHPPGMQMARPVPGMPPPYMQQPQQQQYRPPYPPQPA